MLEKDPDDRMTINDVLDLSFMIEHAARHLPRDVFLAEFPRHADLLPPLVLKLPVRPPPGVYDTAKEYGKELVSYGVGF